MIVAFIAFVLISSFTMLNMLIGILCEVVQATGEGQRYKNTETKMREAITTLFQGMDKDKNGEITREEFVSMKSDKYVMDSLQELDVKPKHFEMYAELLFREDADPNSEGFQMQTFDFDKIVDMILRLRPGTKVSALDFASFQAAVCKNMRSFKSHLAAVEQMTSLMTGEVLKEPEPRDQTASLEQSPPLSGHAADAKPEREPADSANPPADALGMDPRASMSSMFGNAGKQKLVEKRPERKKITDKEILAELQRRFSVASDKKDVPKATGLENSGSLGNENLTEDPEDLEDPDFHEVLVTRVSQEWSPETYTC